MSLQFSDTTNKDGIIQRIEQELGWTDGFISGNNTRMAQWAGSINLALDKVFTIIFDADGRWQFDDQNHTKNPVIYTNLTVDQKIYNFNTDEQTNLILDIHAVYARQSASDPYYLLDPRDAQSGGNTNFTDGITVSAWPSAYDKTGNGIKLDTTPPSTVANGLQIFISREGSYFATAPTFDTTKTPGFYGLHHEYLVLEPCYRYARANNLKKQETFKRDVLEMEKAIKETYGRRARDERHTFSPRITRYR